MTRDETSSQWAAYAIGLAAYAGTLIVVAHTARALSASRGAALAALAGCAW